MRLLLVEDDVRLAEVVANALRRASHHVHIERTCADARTCIAAREFDLALLDIGLPDGSGIDLCRTLRTEGRDLPVLLLTARNEVRDRVSGLDAGADDYLGKPFELDELLARVRALGRRGPRLEESVRTFGLLVLDRRRHLAEFEGVKVPLTPRELDIVFLLAWRDGHVVQRSEIIERIWGEMTPSAQASFDVLLTRIRRKLSIPGAPAPIRTVREVGYAWALALSARN
jgi:DNA-binding response OmpR family regulator